MHNNAGVVFSYMTIMYWSCRFDADAADLFGKFLLYDKDKRMVAEPAMLHPYFQSLGPHIAKLPANDSIFSLPNIQLQKDPGLRSSGISHGML